MRGKLADQYPSMIRCTDRSGSVKSLHDSHHDDNDRLHRHDGPARLTLTAEGRKIEAEWFLHGKPFRAEGPATYGYSPNTAIMRWATNAQHDKRHRLDGPGYVYASGTHSTSHLEWDLCINVGSRIREEVLRISAECKAS